MRACAVETHIVSNFKGKMPYASTRGIVLCEAAQSKRNPDCKNPFSVATLNPKTSWNWIQAVMAQRAFACVAPTALHSAGAGCWWHHAASPELMCDLYTFTILLALKHLQRTILFHITMCIYICVCVYLNHILTFFLQLISIQTFDNFCWLSGFSRFVQDLDL